MPAAMQRQLKGLRASTAPFGQGSPANHVRPQGHARKSRHIPPPTHGACVHQNRPFSAAIMPIARVIHALNKINKLMQAFFETFTLSLANIYGISFS